MFPDYRSSIGVGQTGPSTYSSRLENVAKMSAFKPYDVLIPFSERAQLLLETNVKEAADLAVKHRILIV